MRNAKQWVKVAGGAAFAAAVVLSVPGPEAAARNGASRSGALRMTDIDVDAFAGIEQNHIVTMKFTQPINPSSVNPATVQVRAQNATNTGYPIDVPGTFQVAGSTIRFYPRLPTHLRDPAKTDGSFYQPGTFQDDATNNAAFQPSRNHQITVLGNPSSSPIRSTKGRVLNRTYTARFTTAPALPKSSAFTIDNYSDAPPPGFEFSNPPDKVASAVDLYARHGGTQDVPSDIDVTLFGNKVPLSPATVRQSGNVTLTMLARRDNPLFTKPIEGVPSIEQNFDTVRLVYSPKFPLPDLGTFSLKVLKNVRDLTETYDFKNNAERLRLRDIYEFMVAARNLAPGVPASELADPPVNLIYDWPTDPQIRGVLKTNVLTLGDNFPAEIDPRVMILFTTQDEPVSRGQLIVNFLTAEGYFDAPKSSADWDLNNSGVASGAFTFAGGSGVDGDLFPAATTTISSDNFAQNTLNWRKVNIPQNVVVNVTGSRPATLKALDFQCDGSLRADGLPGVDVPSTTSGTAVITANNPTPPAGGKGGPGGGSGGIGNNSVTPVGQQAGTGVAGNDALGNIASADQGGRGGTGGYHAATTVYCYGGGGGGGGARTAGTAGAKGTYSTASWNGNAGVGGAGALGNSDLATLVGGAGGGAGGSGATQYYNWGAAGGTGGGGGGAMIVQTASRLRVGANGSIRARGGVGGNGCGVKSNWAPGPGGGGGGGSLLLRSAKGFDIADLAKGVDVLGGAGGVQNPTGGVAAASGGAGGVGFIRLESPTGGMLIPGGTAGTYSAVGAGLPSYVYSKFIDLGVDQPKITDMARTDFTMDASNDAIFIEVQAAIEDPKKLGTAKTTAIDKNENSTNTAEVSDWKPLRLIDNTPSGKAFTVPGNTQTDAVFPIQAAFLNKNYKFVRMRISFQMDDTQSSSSPVPYVDQVVFHFDFNF